jgi:hypothetical protein
MELIYPNNLRTTHGLVELSDNGRTEYQCQSWGELLYLEIDGVLVISLGTVPIRLAVL